MEPGIDLNLVCFLLEVGEVQRVLDDVVLEVDFVFEVCILLLVASHLEVAIIKIFRRYFDGFLEVLDSFLVGIHLGGQFPLQVLSMGQHEFKHFGVLHVVAHLDLAAYDVKRHENELFECLVVVVLVGLLHLGEV